ncbi:MAG: Rne/Rng family ribonuclease [Bacteroidales bacterium]|nr:Rne/Rng family ribonuclease [Candidatus Liminaster caballi]
MTREVVIDVQPKEITIGLLEDGRLAEYQRESQNASFSVGNIYLAKVRKLMPGLNAAFVDVGCEKEGFIHYQDLGLQFRTLAKFVKQQLSDRKHQLPLDKVKREMDMPKDGTVSDVLQQGQEILVQIAKEPISTKGPRLTSDISLPGRFMVLIPFQDKVSVSAKIKSSEEKSRLKQIVNAVRPKNFGVIVRTSAQGVQAEEIEHEMTSLMHRWDESMQKLMKGQLPSLVYEETSRAVALLRDIFNPSFENIWVNDLATFNQIKEYVHLIAPEKAGVVKLYEGELPILDKFDVTRQIKSSLGKTVSCKSGAYIIIEHTEALHVIDVNSGHRSHQADDQEENALAVDMAAAEEIARQMRLRDMGGIVVIDFIDLAKAENREALFQHMKQLMQGDRAKHNILPLSKFCLMQITRQRVRPVMDVQTAESCPVCGGRHVVKPSLLFPDILESKLEYLTGELKVKRFRLHVHPFIAAYLKRGLFFSRLWKWKMKFGWGMRLIPDQSLEFLQYKAFDADRNEIDLKQPIDSQV